MSIKASNFLENPHFSRDRKPAQRHWPKTPTFQCCCLSRRDGAGVEIAAPSLGCGDCGRGGGGDVAEGDAVAVAEEVEEGCVVVLQKYKNYF